MNGLTLRLKFECRVLIAHCILFIIHLNIFFFEIVVSKMWTANNSMIVYLDGSGTECMWTVSEICLDFFPRLTWN